MNKTNTHRAEAMRLMKDAGLLGRDDLPARHLRALTLQTVAELDDRLRRLGWFGRLKLRFQRAFRRTPRQRWPS